MIPPLTYDPPSNPITEIHRDDDLLVVDKPAGLLSVPGKAVEHADCLLARLQAIDPAVRLVHRLDMDTSGVMVFARNPSAQRHLGLQFERRYLQKSYVARVHGSPDELSGVVVLPLIADWPNRPLQKVCHDTGKPALTEWRVLQSGPCSRLLLKPAAGRSHQLRVHMAAMGHAICGDRFYGSAEVRCCTDRLYLHASELALRHPDGGAWHTFKSDVPF